MQVRQKMSILFFRKTTKKDKQGNIPIYCRVTVDGLRDEISTGCKVPFDHWNTDNKEVSAANPFYRAYNKKLSQMKSHTDHRDKRE